MAVLSIIFNLVDHRRISQEKSSSCQAGEMGTQDEIELTIMSGAGDRKCGGVGGGDGNFLSFQGIGWGVGF